MQVRFYLQRLSDAEAGGLSRLVCGLLEQAGDEPRPLGWWLMDILRDELDRRDAIDDGDDCPPEVACLRLPSWDGQEIGIALVEIMGYCRTPLRPAAAEFLDAVALSIAVLAKRRLTLSEGCYVR